MNLTVHWIYYEDGKRFYCGDCIDDRIEEANENREFEQYIDYKNGEKNTYFTDVYHSSLEPNYNCSKCGKPINVDEEMI